MGLLRTVGAFPYYYDPPASVQETAEAFLKSWRDPVAHQKLLVRILSYEG